MFHRWSQILFCDFSFQLKKKSPRANLGALENERRTWQTKDQTPLLPSSGTRKVVRTHTNTFETVVNAEVPFQKKSSCQKIFPAGPRTQQVEEIWSLLSGLGRIPTQERLYLEPYWESVQNCCLYWVYQWYDNKQFSSWSRNSMNIEQWVFNRGGTLHQFEPVPVSLSTGLIGQR